MEWLTFGLSALCAIASFIGFILAQREKKEAKKSEAAAKEYAENANKANLEIQKFVHHQNTKVDEQDSFDVEKEKVWRHIREFKEKMHSGIYGIEEIVKALYQNQCDRSLLNRILEDLESDNMIKSRKISNKDRFYRFQISQHS